jgi:hypothetical protein
VPLQGTFWQYYCLRGTQTDFVDSMGNPIILGTTQMEEGMQSTSSCMGCHARASIGDRKDHLRAANGERIYPPGSFFYPGGLLWGDEKEGANRLTVDVAKVFWSQDPQNPDRNMPLVTSANGAPRPDFFVDAGNGGLRYTQLDFLWEFLLSAREPAPANR